MLTPVWGLSILQVHAAKPLYLGVVLVFFTSFPALLSEMILLGCLDDDDFPSHPFLWEGFLPADIFFLSEFSACRSSLFPPRGGTSPLPITSRTRIKIPAIHSFFPLLFPRQALIFPLAVILIPTAGAALGVHGLGWRHEVCKGFSSPGEHPTHGSAGGKSGGCTPAANLLFCALHPCASAREL